jgi:hypothetical protein
MNRAEVKALQGRIQTASAEAAELNLQREELARKKAEVEKALDEKKKDLDLLRVQFASVQKQAMVKKPLVTDHAMLRYLERVRMINLNGLEDEIIPPGYHMMAMGHEGKVRIGNSHSVVMRDGAIITVTPANKPHGAGKVRPWAKEDEDDY